MITNATYLIVKHVRLLPARIVLRAAMISLIVRPVVVLSWPLAAVLLAEEALVIHAPDRVIVKA